MPLRGERIGTAYVRILADGAGLDESVEREMRDADPVMEHAGKEHSASYWEGFNDETKKNKEFEKGLDEKVMRSRGKVTALGRAMGGRLADGTGEGFQDRITRLLTPMFRDAGFGDRAEAMGKQAGEVWADNFVRSGSKEFDAERLFATVIRQQHEFETKWRASFDRTGKDISNLVTGARTDLSKMKTALGDAGDAVGDLDTITSSFTFNFRQGWQKINPPLKEGERRIDRVGDVIGRSFGKGSRNDFLNFVGSVIGGGTKGLLGLTKVVTDAGKGLFRMATGFGKNAEEAQSFSQKFATVLGEMGGFAARSGPVVIGIVTALVEIIGPAASLISTLAGAITALAASVAYALGAGLGVFAGLLPIVATGIAGIALAIKGLPKKQVGELFAPMKKDLEDLQKTLGKDLFAGIKAAMPGIKTAFKEMSPVIEDVGDSFAFVGAQIGYLLGSADFRQFAKVLGEQLTNTLNELSTAFVQVFRGFMGVARQAMPLAEDFAGWIASIATEFGDWANSVEGQKWLADFFDDAADSAKSIGGFLKSIWDFLGPILSSGRETGDTIIDKMADAIERAAKWLESPAGQKALKQWFEDAKNVAFAIGDIIKSVIHFIDVLDTPENRKKVQKFFQAIAWIINFVADHWNVVNFFFKWLTPIGQAIQAFKFLRFALGKIIDAFNLLREKGGQAIKFVRDKFGDLRDWVKDKFDDIKDKIKSAAQWLIDKFENAWEWFRGKLADVAGWVRDKFGDIKDKIADAASWVKTKFSAAWDWLRGAAANIASDVKTKLGDIIDWFRDLPDKIRGYATSLYNAGNTLGSNIIDGLRNGISKVGGLASSIGSTVANAVKDALNDLLDLPLDVHLDPPGPLGPWDFTVIPRFASGGVFNKPTLAMVGESGPEAVVPMARSLAQVDPSVRQLSAVAQGIPGPPGAAAMVTVPTGKTVDVGSITIITPTEDPRAVAAETVSRIVAATYF